MNPFPFCDAAHSSAGTTTSASPITETRTNNQDNEDWEPQRKASSHIYTMSK